MVQITAMQNFSGARKHHKIKKCLVPQPKKNTKSFSLSIAGAIVYYLPLDMTPLYVLAVAKRSDEIRNKYIQNPPEGMTADDIRHMSEDDLLDMDYFLNEDDEFGKDFPGPEGFYIF